MIVPSSMVAYRSREHDTVAVVDGLTATNSKFVAQ
jgi:hypothetical protein